MKENRKFIRLQAPIGVTYKIIDKNKYTKPQLSLIKDISGGGVRIMVKEDLRAGDLIDMEIQIPLVSQPVHAVGEVVWFSSVTDRERPHREAGVRFCDIGPKDLHCILEYVYTVGIG